MEASCDDRLWGFVGDFKLGKYMMLVSIFRDRSRFDRGVVI